jgi:hypothetical protein
MVHAVQSRSFWKSQENWPSDPAGYVFLARAVQVLGKALDPEWTGEEPSIAESMQLVGHRAAPTGKTPFLPKQTPEEIAAFKARFQTPEVLERVRLRKVAEDRWRKVQREVAAQCESGKLLTVGRPVAGGNLYALPQEWWRTERLSPRFVRCQIDPTRPFSDAVSADEFWWIFIEEHSLNGVITGTSQKDGASDAPPHKKALSSFSSAQVERAYKDRIAEIGEGHSSESDDIEYFKKLFRINRDAVRGLRRDLAPAHWKEGGRPKQPRGKTSRKNLAEK